jgi:uncharacterized membrane protein
MVIVGALLLAAGAAFLFIPVVPQANQTVTANSEEPYSEVSVGGISLMGVTPVQVSWTVGSPVDIAAAACSSSCAASDVGALSGLTVQSGRSGSFTLEQPNGGSIVLAVTASQTGGPVNVTFRLTAALSTVGSGLLIAGALLLILGVVFRSTRRASPIPAAASPVENTPASNPP